MENWKKRVRFATTMSNPEWKGMNIHELERELRKKMDEVYRLRMEIDRRKGDVPKAIDFDYEKYVTQ